MAKVDNGGTVTLQELIVSSLAQTDARCKILVEKGLITQQESMEKLSAERATYQAMFKSVARYLKYKIKVCQLVLKDSRTPRLAKVLLGLAVAYIPFPFGVIISPALIIIALKLIPKGVIEYCSTRANRFS